MSELWEDIVLDNDEGTVLSPVVSLSCVVVRTCHLWEVVTLMTCYLCTAVSVFANTLSSVYNTVLLVLDVENKTIEKPSVDGISLTKSPVTQST